MASLVSLPIKLMRLKAWLSLILLLLVVEVCRSDNRAINKALQVQMQMNWNATLHDSHFKGIIDRKYVANHTHSQYKADEFQLMDFHSRQFYIKAAVKGTDSIIDWIVGEFEGEGKVARVFEDTLRIGFTGDKQNGRERGLCTPFARNVTGGRAIVLDIGANAGIYGFYATALGCRAYLFDIQEDCQRWISSTIDKNRFHHAALIPYAVGNSSMKIHIPKKSNSCHGTFTISKTGDEYFTDAMKTSESEEVDMIRIDDLFANAMSQKNLPHIALIKIDVEGAEVGVLSGMKALLQHVNPVTNRGTVRHVVCEVTPNRWAGLPNEGLTRETVAEIFCEVLWDVGFQTITVFSNNNKEEKAKGDLQITSRTQLYEHIKSGDFYSKDFHFKRYN